MPRQFLNNSAMSVADDQAEANGVDALTPREREVLEAIIAGASNKVAGRKLRISPRTVEVHRARIIDKLGAKNTADLVRIVLAQKASLSPRH
jgi:two-component system, LuxR family, response regulator FixJ